MPSLDTRLALAAFAAHGKRPWLDRFAVFCARELIVLLFAAETAILARHFFLIDGSPAGFWTLESLRGLRAVSSFALAAWIAAVVLEMIFRRPRPFVALHKPLLADFWLPLPSMPSSHAAITFALAVPAFLLSVPLGLVFLAAAIAVSASRVYVGVHYLSDVMVGAAIGILVGGLVLRWVAL